ncbi:MAG: hypothetical protein M1824_002178, partial [Vezdaea acicularis]
EVYTFERTKFPTVEKLSGKDAEIDEMRDTMIKVDHVEDPGLRIPYSTFWLQDSVRHRRTSREQTKPYPAQRKHQSG